MSLEEVEEFLKNEAELVDDRKFDEWLEQMTDDLEYRIPIRSTREDPEEEFSDTYHVDDNRYRLEKRVERLKTEYAWAEQPPARTRHFVSNVRVKDHREVNGNEEIDARSNLMLYVTRGDAADPVILSGERHDVLRRTDGLRLAKRRVLLDNTTLPLDRISIFI